MEKRSANLSAILGLVGAARGMLGGWRSEYRTPLQRLTNTARGAGSGFFNGLDFLERSFGPYASHLIAGQARKISSDPNRSNFARGVARKIGAGRARIANKFQAHVNPAEPKDWVGYGRKAAYQLAQASMPGADMIGALFHRVSPGQRRERKIISSLFGEAPKLPYTDNLNKLEDKINSMASGYIQGFSYPHHLYL